MELKYHRCGDYLLPDLGLTEEEQNPVGKYGMMRMNYLKEHRPGLFNRLLLSGKLMDHLHEIDTTCHARLNLLIPQMKEAEGLTEALKMTDQSEWVRRMNSIHHRIPCTNTLLLSKELQRHFRVVTTCQRQLVGYDGAWQKRDE